MDSITEREKEQEQKQRQAHRVALAARIILLRERKGWTTTDLAVEAGISQPSLWAIEKADTKEVTASTIASLCAALGTTWDYLWAGIERTSVDAATEAELISAFRSTDPTARPAVVQTALELRKSFPLKISESPKPDTAEKLSKSSARPKTVSSSRDTVDKQVLVNHQGGQNAKRSTAKAISKPRGDRDAKRNARTR